MLHAREDEEEAPEDASGKTAFFNLTWWQIVCLAFGIAAVVGVGVWIGIQRVRNRKKLKQMPDPLLPTVDPKAKERSESGMSEATIDSLGSQLDKALIKREKAEEGAAMHHRRKGDRRRRRWSGEGQGHRRNEERDERAPRRRFRDSVFSSYHSMKKAAVKLRYMEAKAKLKEELRREALEKLKEEKNDVGGRRGARGRRDGAAKDRPRRRDRGSGNDAEGSKESRRRRRGRPRVDATKAPARTRDLSPDSVYSQRDTVYLPAPAVGQIRGPTPKPLMPAPRKPRRQRSKDEESYVSLDILSGYTSDEPKRKSAYPQQVDIEELAAEETTHGVAGINAAIWQTALQWGRKAGLAA